MARDVFAEHGFRDPAGRPLPDDAGLGGDITIMTLTDESIAQETLRAWAVLALPIRTLVAVDVSASMSTAVGGSTRLHLTEQAARSGTAMFPGSVQAGLWVFADDLGENGQDHREILPIRRLDATVDGQAQRDLMNSLSTIVTSEVSDRSALYDTTLAAFRQMQATYDPRAINSVIVLTDGADDEPDGITQEELIATLEREQNPARPVVIVTVGLTADATRVRSRRSRTPPAERVTSRRNPATSPRSSSVRSRTAPGRHRSVRRSPGPATATGGRGSAGYAAATAIRVRRSPGTARTSTAVGCGRRRRTASG